MLYKYRFSLVSKFGRESNKTVTFPKEAFQHFIQEEVYKSTLFGDTHLLLIDTKSNRKWRVIAESKEEV